MRRSVAGTAALLITMFIAACSFPAATGTPTAAVTPATATSSATLSAAPASAEPSLPPVPDGLPVMPGAVAQDPAGEPGIIARWSVDAIGPDVYAYYLGALPAAGFVIDQQLPGGNVAVIRFAAPHGDAFELTLVGEDGGERTRIGLRLPEAP